MLKPMLSGIWSMMTDAQLFWYLDKRGPFATRHSTRQLFVFEGDKTNGVTWIRRYDIQEVNSKDGRPGSPNSPRRFA